MSECVEIAGWIADSVTIPVIMDGDTGHGGIMAVRRMVRECIRRGIAGVRIDDQPIEGKRKTQSAGVEVVPLDLAIARYRAAVDMKNELDPNFVVMAQCYARDAAIKRAVPVPAQFGGGDLGIARRVGDRLPEDCLGRVGHGCHRWLWRSGIVGASRNGGKIHTRLRIAAPRCDANSRQ